jgi:hypothetical protein
MPRTTEATFFYKFFRQGFETLLDDELISGLS